MNSELYEHFEHIDSAVFSGCTFHNKDDREILKNFVNRWNKEMKVFEEIDAEDDQTTPNDQTVTTDLKDVGAKNQNHQNPEQPQTIPELFDFVDSAKVTKYLKKSCPQRGTPEALIHVGYCGATCRPCLIRKDPSSCPTLHFIKMMRELSK